MSEKGMNAAIILIAICAVTSVGILSFDKLAPAPPPLNVDIDALYEDIYPGAQRGEEVPLLRAIVSFPQKKIYEGDEFRVDVIDQKTKLPIEGANVSFIRPEIRLRTNEYGVVFFSAPHIKDRYLRESTDTWCKFPLIIEKEGYETFRNEVFVYLQDV